VSAAETLALAIPSVVSGAVLIAARAAFASRADMGRRIGELEKARDIETGRRQGYEQAQREAAAATSKADGR
jgi:hypothetical protein